MGQVNENIEIPSRGRPKKKSDLDDTPFNFDEHGRTQTPTDYNYGNTDDYRNSNSINQIQGQTIKGQQNQHLKDQKTIPCSNVDSNSRIYKDDNIIKEEYEYENTFVHAETKQAQNINMYRDESLMQNRNENNEYKYETTYIKNYMTDLNEIAKVNCKNNFFMFAGKTNNTNQNNAFQYVNKTPQTLKKDKQNNYNYGDRLYSNTYNAVNGSKFGQNNQLINSKDYNTNIPNNPESQNFVEYCEDDKYDYSSAYVVNNQIQVSNPQLINTTTNLNNQTEHFQFQEQYPNYTNSNSYNTPQDFVQLEGLQYVNQTQNYVDNGNYNDQGKANAWMSKKKRRNSSFTQKYQKNTVNSSLVPSEFSSIKFMTQPENTKKRYLGTLKQSFIKVPSNNTILPLYLNSSSSYDNLNYQEFDRIAANFLKKASNFDYENITVQQLKILMKEFGLSHTGKKHELIERVKNTGNLIAEKTRMDCVTNIKSKNPQIIKEKNENIHVNVSIEKHKNKSKNLFMPNIEDKGKQENIVKKTGCFEDEEEEWFHY